MANKTKAILWTMIIIFVLIVSFFIIPEDPKRSLFLVAAILAAIFLVLGVILIFLARHEKGKKKLFLMLVGFSAAGFLVLVILHNLMYALAVLTENIVVLHYTFEFLHAAFFLIGLIGCPIGFIVGVVGYFVKKK